MKNFYIPLLLILLLHACADDNQSTSAVEVDFRVSDMSLQVGETGKASVTYTPSDATPEPEFTYSSSDPSVFMVSSDGTVTALSAGMANLEVKLGDKSKFATVIVNSAPVSYNFAFKNFVHLFYEGEMMELNTDIYTSNVPSARISWEISDETIAQYNPEERTVYGIRPGDFILTAEIPGGKTYELEVTVVREATFYIALKEPVIEMRPGQSRRFPEYITLPANISADQIELDIVWVDGELATVGLDGITALSPGVTEVYFIHSPTHSFFEGNFLTVNVLDDTQEDISAELEYRNVYEGVWIEGLHIINNLPGDIHLVELRAISFEFVTPWYFNEQEVVVESNTDRFLEIDELHPGVLTHALLLYNYQGEEYTIVIDTP